MNYRSFVIIALVVVVAVVVAFGSLSLYGVAEKSHQARKFCEEENGVYSMFLDHNYCRVDGYHYDVICGEECMLEGDYD